MTLHTPEFLAARHAAMVVQTGFVGVDELDPKGPSGHAYGLRISTMLTTDYRRRLVGYLPMPRATQDVGVMVPYKANKKVSKLIAARWPMLDQVDLPQVIRFLDPTDRMPGGPNARMPECPNARMPECPNARMPECPNARMPGGSPKPVIDVMLPWSPFQQTILEKHILHDTKTRSRYPTVEAVLASKYPALGSPHRGRDKNEQDAVDFRKVVRANHASIDNTLLRELADQI